MHPGDIVDDRFEIVRRAGSGGMGVVYEGKDRATGRKVALKVLSRPEEGLGDRFAQEIELLATLEHPHIVGYVGHGTTASGAAYLVMPWLEGFDLQVRIGKEPLSIDETYTLARAVADALACLHGRGLVHRDLKPSNLFLQRGRVDLVQLIDLGIARASIPTRALTISGVLVGTPGYIAPEQARGDREIAPAVDIFALGCVLFECLTGKALFGGQHMMAVLAKVLLEDPPRVRELRPDVPDALDRLVHRMVAKDPDQRPKDGAELGQWLDDVRLLTASIAPPPKAQANTLTATEQRVVTVVVVVLPRAVAPAELASDATRADVDPFRSTSARFGVRVHLLAERTAIALAPEGVSAADQASVLARFGRYVTESLPGACVALATGSAVTAGRLPVGEAIDKGIAMVRAALPGEGVNVDEVSAALITSRFDIRRDGRRLVLEGERTSLDPTRLLLGRPTSCIGRDRELAILDATLAECVHGSGPKVVLLTAPSGAGKSRVGHEFVRRLRAGETRPRVLQGRGDPLHQSTPYSIVAQAVRQAFEVKERDPQTTQRATLEARVAELVPRSDVARVAAFLGELLGVIFEDSGNVPLRAARQSAAAMADQIRLAFEDVLRAFCRGLPVVLVLEDLHWADGASVKLLDGALRKLAGEALMVLALARPEVHERFPGIFSHRDLTEVRLPPLPRRACARLVKEVMGDGAESDEIDRLVTRSEGNAFYLEELIRAAAERARSTSVPPPPSGREPLPTTVIAVAQSRLERLEPRVRKVLRAASIFGERFWVEAVASLVGETPTALEPIVVALIEQEAIAPAEGGRLAGMRELAFRHALLRGAAYETLTDEDRALGHRLAAEWLERAAEDREVVALHWLEAGERARAAASFAAAADVRWARAQADAAARCAVRALLVTEPGATDAETIAQRVRRLADALEATRRIDPRDVMAGLDRHVAYPPDAPRTIAHLAVERAAAAARADEGARAVPLVLAHGACVLGALADFDGAKKLVAEATAIAGADEARLLQVRYASAKVAFWGGEHGVPATLLGGGLLPAEPRERLEMLLLLATAAVSVGGRAALDRALDLVSRAEALAGAPPGGGGDPMAEDPVAQSHCLKARFFCHAFAGDHENAAAAALLAVAAARRGGLRYEECAHLHNAGESYLQLGAPEKARAALAEASELARDLGVDRLLFPNEVLVAYLDGRADRLEALAEGPSAANDPWHELHARYWLGRLLVAQRRERARVVLERARELARRLEVREMDEDAARALAELEAHRAELHA